MTPFELVLSADNFIFNSITDLEKDKVYHPENFDRDNPQHLIDKTDEYWENEYDAHKEQCSGCELCKA